MISQRYDHNPDHYTFARRAPGFTADRKNLSTAERAVIVLCIGSALGCFGLLLFAMCR